jgi:hypothetical protein
MVASRWCAEAGVLDRRGHSTGLVPVEKCVLCGSMPAEPLGARPRQAPITRETLGYRLLVKRMARSDIALAPKLVQHWLKLIRIG